MSDESTPQAARPSEMELLRAEIRAGFQSVGTRLEGIDSRLAGHDKRFDDVDRRFDDVDKRLDEVDRRFDQVDRRFDQVDRRFDEVDRRFDATDKRLDATDQRLDATDQRLDGHDTRLVSIETRITTEAEDTRRHFDVVAVGLHERFKGVVDKTVATGRKVDRLIASNAIEHAAFQEFVTDHEVRITRLEGMAGQDPKSPATNQQT